MKGALMANEVKHVKFGGRILIVGFGSIGSGVLPLLLRHIDMPAANIAIITAEEHGRAQAAQYGVRFMLEPLTRENYVRVLDGLVKPGDFILNLSIDVSSVALIEYCAARNIKYLDTCIEPWVGGYTDPNVSPGMRSNYALREAALEIGRKHPNGPTAVLTHGANPGMVSHMVKEALLNVARDTGLKSAAPQSKADWARLAQQVGLKVVHIAERDTQVSSVPKRVGEFVNTWSVGGFIGEGSQPAELGWGAHEKHFPHDGQAHEFGCRAAIWLQRPGASVRVRTWTPRAGTLHGFLITHGESISIADYFTVKEGERVVSRPTVHYAYHPCDAAVMSIHELAGNNWQPQKDWRILGNDIVSGVDELGVLLAGHKKNAYWYGSVLSIDEARKLCPYNNATSLQVASAVLAATIWAIKNPNRGVVDPDDLPYDQILDIQRPYLGALEGHYTDWTPLVERGTLFPEDVDASDAWQFKNVRVV
jgi:homospermidine synthase